MTASLNRLKQHFLVESNKNSDTDAQGSWFMGIKYWIYSTYDDHIGAFGKLHTPSDRQAIYLSKCSIPTHITTSTNGASYYIGNHFWEIWSYAWLASQPTNIAITSAQKVYLEKWLIFHHATTMTKATDAWLPPDQQEIVPVLSTHMLAPKSATYLLSETRIPFYFNDSLFLLWIVVCVLHVVCMFDIGTYEAFYWILVDCYLVEYETICLSVFLSGLIAHILINESIFPIFNH